MALGNPAHDLARENIEGGIQAGGVVAVVAVGATLNRTEAQRQLWLCVRPSA